MLIESFSQSILRWLRIPPGSSVRKADQPGTSSQVDIDNNDYIQTILDITVDDICVGDDPLSISFDVAKTGKAAEFKLRQFCAEFNTEIKDVARDLLQKGYSILSIDIDPKKNRMLAFPYIDAVEFYITKDKKIVAFAKDGKSEQLENKLIFINYNKSSLQKIENHTDVLNDCKFKVIPVPMQLKNADRTISGLVNAENSIAKYRNMLRPVRYANVDIGTAQGDVQNQTVDSIASAINCNSEGLGNGTAFTEFDDNIPVLPNRKGLGKVEIGSDIPTANVRDLADLEYWLNKLNLVMRFPGTYMDFSKALSESAVSMIRGDLRYTKLCKAVQSKLIGTLNDFIQSSKFSKYKPVFSLTTIPSSEDDDVLQALGDYTDLAKDVEEFVIGTDAEEKPDAKLHRLKLIKDLFSMSVSSPMLQKWFDDFESYITKFNHSQSEEGGEVGDEFDLGGEGGEDLGGGEGLDIDLEPGGEGGEVEDIEILEPQSI